MDVELYVYDLSRGMARQFSMALTGTYIEAIYHTSLVFGGIEYFFGQGVHRTTPGSTHHGQPMKIIQQGTTELPLPVIEEYMESLAEIYTAESYDLFLHNCNNFTQDLSTFLVGKDIPEDIRTLPDRFLQTPLGQMMKPQIDAALRGITQAPVVEKPGPTSNSSTLQPSTPSQTTTNGVTAISPRPEVPASQLKTLQPPRGVVHNVTSLQQVKSLLESAQGSCAVIFFTSSTCAPCKIVYPAYDELAEEAGPKAVLIKVDINQAFEIAQKFQVRATPTFQSFCRGQEMDTWSGANEAQLRSKVRFLIETTYPPHPHTRLRLPNFQASKQPVLYKKVPPIEKLAAKIGPLAESSPLASLMDFNKSRFGNTQEPAASTPLPHQLISLPDFLAKNLSSIPIASRFAVVDLLRISFVDPRISGFFAAEDPSHTALLALLTPISTSLNDNPSDSTALPYALHLITLQLLSNLFTTPLYPPLIFSPSSDLHETILNITTSSLLSTNPTIVHTAAALSYNLSIALHNNRFHLQQHPDSAPSSSTELHTEAQVSLTASLAEALQTLTTTDPAADTVNGTKQQASTSPRDVLQALLLALGLLIYGAEMDGEVMDLCRAMGVKDMLKELEQGNKDFKGVAVLKEVREML